MKKFNYCINNRYYKKSIGNASLFYLYNHKIYNHIKIDLSEFYKLKKLNHKVSWIKKYKLNVNEIYDGIEADISGFVDNFSLLEMALWKSIEEIDYKEIKWLLDNGANPNYYSGGSLLVLDYLIQEYRKINSLLYKSKYRKLIKLLKKYDALTLKKLEKNYFFKRELRQIERKQKFFYQKSPSVIEIEL